MEEQVKSYEENEIIPLRRNLSRQCLMVLKIESTSFMHYLVQNYSTRNVAAWLK